MQEFQGKVAVVTGAASGIGLAVTERFVAEGMKVVMADVEKGKTREEEYVPADYVAPAEADEQVKGGRWSPVCDWPLAFREALERTAEEAAPHLPRAQSATLLLRTCGLGHLAHLTRLLAPAATADFAWAADEAALATFARLARLDELTPTQARQARLSVRRGGMGLRSVHELRRTLGGLGRPGRLLRGHGRARGRPGARGLRLNVLEAALVRRG